ncbi:hypothetical protein T5.141 [Escherichia phage T5]|uniref:Putative endonuclease n=8 Tax=root TaxID=1 RepID=ENDO2_BPT5|nr:endonuclease [Escherichia phage T5]Q6QGE6.1 RecName: Full=Putative endonuclease [Escherichia phage T5]AAS77180.1 hypothetical protein T5.141 [Escherichia phage T5]
MGKKITKQDRESQISNICNDKNLSFVGWIGEYTNIKSTLTLKCNKCYYTWSPRLDNFLRITAQKCPACAGKARWTKEEREEQIKSKCAEKGYNFLSWSSTYINKDSKIILKCLKDGCIWDVSIHHFINHDTGCPDCASGGFNPNIPATFYIQKLTYQGTHFLKFGITGKDVLERMRQQSNKSLCEHSVIFSHTFSYGSMARGLEKVVKDSVNTGVLDKRILPDGYTETCHYSELETILSLTNSFIQENIR